ncbi:hypothetical protein E8E13_007363 [Curvularia kusanoi]|uniref:Uncharacterized protein n=1 Tax=Curvularia kusanoi TaxID=90978 RepID=A0A9P4W8L9_CURKU|nr:hypothetical protein E8E13_007363 [Curvularia kusanoi]
MSPGSTNPSKAPQDSNAARLPQFPVSDWQNNGTYNVIPSLPLSHFQNAPQPDLTDEDAEADEWDNAEYERQMQVHLEQQYGGYKVLELREISKGRGLRVRGCEDELVQRLAKDDVLRMYGGGRSGGHGSGQGADEKGKGKPGDRLGQSSSL